MKTSAIAAALAALAGVASAGPVVFDVTVTFHGAADASYTRYIPADGSTVILNDALSISKISSTGRATCTFHGVDGSVTTVNDGQTVDVGPPQTQTWGTCTAW
ncbi:hypothetical protein ATEIFO6365_0003018600 [Aspergillus terreus]|uniref:Uncharacterized protein n=1 Tax=Aspergillus terreus TaxID=33178 RepID=A0A5M3YQZ3_ASPTE|nr:hypothetical protein ATETN484_0003012500 [Aspergillus terreus]GFF14133.1 hypothetical protein ATEIFO6365_0003018600 [Aspergillus terreus]